jgi:hypothetical protein
MGGNALKKVKTIRKQKQEYEIIKRHILEKTREYLKCDIVIELPNKDSFGDLDVLYIYDPKINVKELVIKLFNPNEIVINGDIMSFDYENFQIDFIKCESIEFFITSQFYFSNGGIGSIIGCIVNYYGIKFGHEGLWINLIENTIDPTKEINMTKIIGKIILSKNPQEICKFLELDYNLWETGFLSNKEIFEWIIKCKYYKKEIFYELNYDHRKRSLKQPIYIEFLEFINITCEINKVNTKYSEMHINLQKKLLIFLQRGLF